MRPAAIASGISAGAAVRASADALAHVGIGEGAVLEARLLVAHVLGISKETLLGWPERALDGPATAQLADLLRRRSRREPMAHLLEKREFWSLPLRVTAATLDPRPDSETLISAALDCFQDRDAALNVLDLGVGSGCLLLALLSEFRKARGLGIDLSEAALEVAKANAVSLGMDARTRFQSGNWGQEIDEKFDLILSNPPYIPDAEIERLQPEIALYESRLALMGGEDGLACYRKMAPDLFRLLQPAGVVLLEIGDTQAAAVSQILNGHGLEVIATQKDLAGAPRCVVGRRPKHLSNEISGEKNLGNGRHPD